MRRELLFFVLIFCQILYGHQAEDSAAVNIYRHLVVKDPIAAVICAKGAVQLFPESKEIHIAYLKALCANGEETEAIQEWERLLFKWPEEKENRQLLETLCWSVLLKAENSSLLLVRLNSLLSASSTRDAKAVALLLSYLDSSNPFLRSFAARLTPRFGDQLLQEKLIELLHRENVWFVRLEVIRALGSLHNKEIGGELEKIVANPKTLFEEKATAIIALVSLYDQIGHQELVALSQSNRSGLRQLACEIIAHLELKREVPLLIPLLKDSCSDVRCSALNALGLMRIKSSFKVVEPCLQDSHPAVAITAAWVLLLQGEERGKELLKGWLLSEDSAFCRLAAGAVAASGKYGVDLAKEVLQKSSDNFVKSTLALGLIGQRKQIKKSCEVLITALKSEKGLWMWEEGENPLFRALSPSRVRHIEQIPQYPKVVDHFTRLEVLAVLSMMGHPKAVETIKELLQNETWGSAGAAALTLLEEGDEESLLVVQELLDDPDQKIRVQAAFILAIFTQDMRALAILQEKYPVLDREMKMHVLEAIGHVGDSSCIPFLLQILKEPYLMLRVMAASALIQCLNH